MQGLTAKWNPSIYGFCPLVNLSIAAFPALSFHIPETCPIFYIPNSDCNPCSCCRKLGKLYHVQIGFLMRTDKLNYGHLWRHGWERTIWMHVITSQKHHTRRSQDLSLRWNNSLSALLPRIPKSMSSKWQEGVIFVKQECTVKESRGTIQIIFGLFSFWQL